MKPFVSIVVAATLVAAVATSSALANHSWNGYHWARTGNPFTLKLGNNLTSAEWQSHLSETSSDWSKAEVARRCGRENGLFGLLDRSKPVAMRVPRNAR